MLNATHVRISVSEGSQEHGGCVRLHLIGHTATRIITHTRKNAVEAVQFRFRALSRVYGLTKNGDWCPLPIFLTAIKSLS